MGLRRNARELALQFLFGLDIQGDMALSAEEAEPAFAAFCAQFGQAPAEAAAGKRDRNERRRDDEFFLPFALHNWEIERCYLFEKCGEDDFCRYLAGNPAVRKYARALALGVCGRVGELDERIAGHARNWRLKRMPAVDRNIVRIAAWELEHGDDVPPQVAINEALEIAKRYATADSAPFINGILDSMNRALRS